MGSSESALADGRAFDTRGAARTGELAIRDPCALPSPTCPSIPTAARRRWCSTTRRSPPFSARCSQQRRRGHGRIVDVIVGRDGRVHAAIIDFGGFLGIGARKIAVDWNALVFASEGKPGAIALELTRNQLRLAPQYKRGEPLVVVGTASGGARAARSREAAAPER
jgi:hypothetical protein